MLWRAQLHVVFRFDQNVIIISMMSTHLFLRIKIRQVYQVYSSILPIQTLSCFCRYVNPGPPHRCNYQQLCASPPQYTQATWHSSTNQRCCSCWLSTRISCHIAPRGRPGVGKKCFNLFITQSLILFFLIKGFGYFCTTQNTLATDLLENLHG